MLHEFWNGSSRSERLGIFAGLLALTGLLVMLGSGIMTPMPAAAAPDFAAPSVSTYVFYPTTALTGTTAVYSAVPRTISGVDVSRVSRWTEATVFVTADVSGTETVTVTPQFSVDGTNWVNAYQTYIANTLVETTTTATSVVTGTETMTATSVTTMTAGNTSALVESLHQAAMSADGSDYFSLPITGDYLRFKIEHTGSVTPTVRVSLRNP